MPQPRQDDFDAYMRIRWAEDARPVDVAREIKDLAAGTDKLAVGEKTVRRRFAEFDEQERTDPAIRREWARFRWPGAMLAGALPWEATRAALDLLCYRDAKAMGRPTNRQAKWFWRVMLAAPDLTIQGAHDFAADLASAEYAESNRPRVHVNIAHIEWRLAYRPWQGEDAEAAYVKATTRSAGRIPSGMTTSVIEPGGEDAMRIALEDRLGTSVGRELYDDIKKKSWRSASEDSSDG